MKIFLSEEELLSRVQRSLNRTVVRLQENEKAKSLSPLEYMKYARQRVFDDYYEKHFEGINVCENIPKRRRA
jgi:hypothetical protein